jgi:DNA-binding LacI/PurR family transcriptional regulator
MRKKPATVWDVARRAQVSPGTVSRALSGSPRISEATRARVRDAAEALHYRPNIAARRLSTGRTLSIAVLVPFFTRPSVSERLSGAVAVLSETPFDLVIHNVATPHQRAEVFRRFPNRQQVDGVLVISLAPREDDLARIRRADVPVVFIDADHESLTDLHRIVIDDVGGGRAATEHLVGLGHTAIGFVGDVENNPFHFTASRDRHRGYREALAAAGLPVRREHYAQGEHGREEARRLALQILGRPGRPTAIVAASDTQAFGVLEAARTLELRVPEDLSVVGYDDVDMAAVAGLTTVRQPLGESGRLGMALLLRLVDQRESAPHRHLLPTELVVRRTTAPPRAGG